MIKKLQYEINNFHDKETIPYICMKSNIDILKWVLNEEKEDLSGNGNLKNISRRK